MRHALNVIVPLAIFGPLLATGIGGVLLDDPSWAIRRGVPLLGAFLSAAAVFLLVHVVRGQAGEISRLRDEVRRLAGR